MIILLSPTKTQSASSSRQLTEPLFLEKALKLWKTISDYDLDDFKSNYKVSSKIANNLLEYFSNYDPVNVAIETYTGISFKNLDVKSWSKADFNFAQDHLLIMSALYGVLRPFDGITFYRLDFTTKINLPLYDYWKDDITNYLNSLEEPIVSLASREYETMVNKDILKVPFVTVEFLENSAKGYTNKATYSKIARGKLASLLIRNRISSIEALKTITFEGYSLNETLSSDIKLVYTR